MKRPRDDDQQPAFERIRKTVGKGHARAFNKSRMKRRVRNGSGRHR